MLTEKKKARIIRAYLKRHYKRNHKGVFNLGKGTQSSQRGYFIHDLLQAQNHRHWLESVRAKVSYAVKMANEDEKFVPTMIKAHGKMLTLARSRNIVGCPLP
jgi:hypothetical protein